MDSLHFIKINELVTFSISTFPIISSPTELEPINLISKEIVTHTSLLPDALWTAVPEPASSIPARKPP